VNLGGTKVWATLSWPNRISILRLLLVAPFVVLLMNQSQWLFSRRLAMAIFIVMAVSDFVDGRLARRLNMKTRLGAILDPLADKVLIICSVVLLSLPDSAVAGARIDNWIVVAVVGKDLWVILGFLVLYLVTDRLVVRPTRFGKACTFGQLVMVGFVLIAPDLNALSPNLGARVATATGWATVGLCALAGVSYTRLGLSVIAAEQKPLDEHNRVA